MGKDVSPAVVSDWQFFVGIGAAIFFGLLNFAVKAMPPWLAWPGVVAGLLIIGWGFVRWPTWLAITIIVCISLAVGGVLFFISSSQNTENANFRVTFYQLVVAPESTEFNNGQQSSIPNPVFLLLRFDNIGQKPSGIFQIELRVDLDGERYLGRRVLFAGSIHLKSGSNQITIPSENDMYYKAEEVIQPGHSVSGMVTFSFPNLPKGKLMAKRAKEPVAKYTLNFQDVYGRKYSFVATFDSTDFSLKYPGIKYGP